MATGFIKEDPWRVLRIMGEFVESFEILSHVRPAVTIFGSARTPKRDKCYQLAVALGEKLARHNIPVITGGGPRASWRRPTKAPRGPRANPWA